MPRRYSVGIASVLRCGVHADVYCVAAKTDRDGPASQSVTMFLLEKGMPGFAVSRALDRYGWRSSDTAELSFQDVRVQAIGGGATEVMVKEVAKRM